MARRHRRILNQILWELLVIVMGVEVSVMIPPQLSSPPLLAAWGRWLRLHYHWRRRRFVQIGADFYGWQVKEHLSKKHCKQGRRECHVYGHEKLCKGSEMRANTLLCILPCLDLSSRCSNRFHSYSAQNQNKNSIFFIVKIISINIRSHLTVKIVL